MQLPKSKRILFFLENRVFMQMVVSIPWLRLHRPFGVGVTLATRLPFRPNRIIDDYFLPQMCVIVAEIIVDGVLLVAFFISRAVEEAEPRISVRSLNNLSIRGCGRADVYQFDSWTLGQLI